MGDHALPLLNKSTSSTFRMSSAIRATNRQHSHESLEQVYGVSYECSFMPSWRFRFYTSNLAYNDDNINREDWIIATKAKLLHKAESPGKATSDAFPIV